MTPADAARVLGVDPAAPWDEVRRAYRDQIRRHHPDRAGTDGDDGGRATAIIEAYGVLGTHRRAAPGSPPLDDPLDEAVAEPVAPGPLDGAPVVARAGGDTLAIAAPADEAFRWLLDAVHDLGAVTYVDRSMPIVEVLCRFEGEPATSLVLDLQGRATHTEVFCTVESIESRPGPPTEAVVDLLELALHRRRSPHRGA